MNKKRRKQHEYCTRTMETREKKDKGIFKMYITREHNKSKAEAIEIIDHSLDTLLKKHLPQDLIKDPYKSWNDEKMSFSFKTKKGLIKEIYISGNIEVTETLVKLDASIPEVVTYFVSENKIKNIINDSFDSVFHINHSH